ncbi:MAG: dipeptidase [candidate division Zixibacteria bacterium]|nr:dipeptidase [candidate division Zixibacteria bacterium]
MTPLEYLKENESKSLDQLKDLLRIPSVSAQSKHKDDMITCANWVSDYLKNLGIKPEIMETGGHPVVFGEYHASDDVPTVLIYGHYDVQPTDPLDLWKTGPFDPIEENGYILARGATDDKGQFFAHLKGIESYLKTVGKAPINVKFLIEGEEEVHSENLPPFIEKHKEKLKADIVLISDGGQFGIDMPAINYGLRGIAAAEIKVTGPDRDLHSGSFGGSVANPINVLAQMIAKLQDEDGKIAIDGFYKDVYTATDWEKEQFTKLPFDAEEYRKSTGSIKLFGEKGYSPLEHTWVRPTLDCNGITGGYQGEGAKTIIPSWASAKITMRLVPDMTPDDILDKLEAYLKKICPDTVTLEIDKMGGANPVQVPTDGPWLDAAAKAIKTGFGKEPFFTKEGGSIPIVESFKIILGLDTLLVGFGQHDDNAHSPNERFLINDFHRGCRTSAALLEELSKVKA